MVTKAGVPANKIFVGQALYGRSFKMATPGCWQEGCKFTGPESGARPGRCTGTSGYISNLEIREILTNGQHKIQRESSPVAGDILIYDDTEWVSWADIDFYNQRAEWARSLGFGGLSDWAIDLNMTGSGSGSEPGGDDEDGENDFPGQDPMDNVVYVDPSVYDEENPLVQCEPPCVLVMPPWTLPYATTIYPTPITQSWTDEWAYVSTQSGGVTTTVYVYHETGTYHYCRSRACAKRIVSDDYHDPALFHLRDSSFQL